MVKWVPPIQHLPVSFCNHPGEIAKTTTEAGLWGALAFWLLLCFTKSFGFVASMDWFLCVHLFIFSNLVSCVVSTQDDYFKSWAPAKSLDQGESCCCPAVSFYPTKYLCPSVTATESIIYMFSFNHHTLGAQQRFYRSLCSRTKFLLVAVSHRSETISHNRRRVSPSLHLDEAHFSCTPAIACVLGALPCLTCTCACVQANKHALEHLGGLIVLQLFEQQRQQTFHLAVAESLLAGFCISSTGTVTLGGSSCWARLSGPAPGGYQALMRTAAPRRIKLESFNAASFFFFFMISFFSWQGHKK